MVKRKQLIPVKNFNRYYRTSNFSNMQQTTSLSIRKVNCGRMENCKSKSFSTPPDLVPSRKCRNLKRSHSFTQTQMHNDHPISKKHNLFWDNRFGPFWPGTFIAKNIFPNSMDGVPSCRYCLTPFCSRKPSRPTNHGKNHDLDRRLFWCDDCQNRFSCLDPLHSQPYSQAFHSPPTHSLEKIKQERKFLQNLITKNGTMLDARPVIPTYDSFDHCNLSKFGFSFDKNKNFPMPLNMMKNLYQASFNGQNAFPFYENNAANATMQEFDRAYVLKYISSPFSNDLKTVNEGLLNFRPVPIDLNQNSDMINKFSPESASFLLKNTTNHSLNTDSDKRNAKDSNISNKKVYNNLSEAAKLNGELNESKLLDPFKCSYCPHVFESAGIRDEHEDIHKNLIEMDNKDNNNPSLASPLTNETSFEPYNKPVRYKGDRIIQIPWPFPYPTNLEEERHRDDYYLRWASSSFHAAQNFLSLFPHSPGYDWKNANHLDNLSNFSPMDDAFDRARAMLDQQHSFSLNSQRSILNHLIKEHVCHVYICNICNSEYDSQEEISKHMISQHLI